MGTVQHESIAKVVSSISSPYMVALVVVIVVALVPPFPQCLPPYLTIPVGILFLSVMPLVITLGYAKIRGIRLEQYAKEYRAAPYALGILAYSAGALVFFLSGDVAMTLISMAYALVTGGMFLVNFKIKASAHVAGIVGPSVVMSFLYGVYGLLLLMFLPPCVWARLALRRHTPLEMLVGALVSIAFTSLSYYIWLEITPRRYF
ncbi:MAG: hypothetical protein ACTSXJ_09920 [Candidatus Baldrarchaeia archaeon]